MAYKEAVARKEIATAPTTTAGVTALSATDKDTGEKTIEEKTTLLAETRKHADHDVCFFATTFMLNDCVCMI